MAITKSVLSIMKDTMDKTLFVIATWEVSRMGGYRQIGDGELA